MKVWSFGEHSSPVDVKTLKVDNTIKNKFIDKRVGPVFNSLLTSYFMDKTYGEGVKEILYFEYCLLPQDSYTSKISNKYSKNLKKIEVVVNLDYQIALKLEVSQFVKYVLQRYLESSESIIDLQIKDFDCIAYCNNLKEYFLKVT